MDLHPRPLPSSVPMRAADLAFMKAPQGRSLPTGYLLGFTGTPPTLAALRARVAQRAHHVPALRYRIARDRRRLERVDRIVVADHVHEVTLPDDADGSHAGRLMLSRPLPTSGRPPWEVWLIHGRPGGYTLCYRTDHAVQDGTGAAHTARALLGDDPCGGPAPHHIARPTLGGVAGTLGYVGAALRGRGSGPAFTVAGTGDSGVCFADASLGRMREIGKLVGATVNDVYLAALAHAIRTWQLKETGDTHPPVPVAVPMSVRRPGAELAPGNRMVTARLLLPCDEETPAAALDRVLAQTDRLRRTRQRDATRFLLAATPRGIGARLGMRMVGRGCVLGPTSNMNFGGLLVHHGNPATDAAVFTDVAAGVLCFISLTGYHDRARLTIVHDDALPTADELPDLWLAALAELERERLVG
jgi:diacylglycerol O-acyltransferase / wax synthase